MTSERDLKRRTDTVVALAIDVRNSAAELLDALRAARAGRVPSPFGAGVDIAAAQARGDVAEFDAALEAFTRALEGRPPAQTCGVCARIGTNDIGGPTAHAPGCPARADSAA